MIKLFMIVIIGYLVGNFSGAVVLSKTLFKEDIREHGSGNAGTTNAIRVYGMKYGVAAFLIDFFKGFFVCMMAYFISGNIGALLGGIAVVIGHDYPLLLGFRGGKGIATSFGVLMWASPLIVTLMFLFFLIVSYVTKYVSLGSICAALAGIFSGIYVMTTKDRYIGLLFIILGVLTIYLHRGNIQRLIRGEESKFSVKK